MSTFDCVLFLHVTGAFLLIGGAVVAGIFNLAAQGRTRPSEVVLLFRLTRAAVVAVSLGLLLTLVFGFWLIDAAHRSLGDFWVWLSLLLWFLAAALGAIGGRRDRATRELATRLTAAGDVPSDELRRRLRDPVSLAFSYGSGLLVLAILALMIWRPAG